MAVNISTYSAICRRYCGLVWRYYYFLCTACSSFRNFYFQIFPYAGTAILRHKDKH